METFLPNGSIVLLKGGNKKLMIYGRKQLLVTDEDVQRDSEDLTMYDYLGVPYPEGYISPEYAFVFNHSDIKEIFFQGYSDQDEEAFQEVLNNA
jgi:hypothetical protein